MLAYVGQTVRLPCYTTLNIYVKWLSLETPRSGLDYIYSNGVMYEAFQSRFSVEVTTVDSSHVYTLVIADVQLNDCMYYLCIEDAGFGNRHFFYLNVTSIRSDFGSVDIVTSSSAIAERPRCRVG